MRNGGSSRRENSLGRGQGARATAAADGSATVCELKKNFARQRAEGKGEKISTGGECSPILD